MIIDGKAIAHQLGGELSQKITAFKATHNITPNLKVVLIGENPASYLYVKNKAKKAAEIGINAETLLLSKEISESKLLATLEQLNKDTNVHGILVQLPLPQHINTFNITNYIDPAKDVDCFHSENIGKLVIGAKTLQPCTPSGCLYLIKKALGPDLTGLNAVVIGRSNIVGKPMFHLLLQENCTPTITHSHTHNLSEKCKEADILIAAIGKPLFVKKSFIKPGAVVIDVGINRLLDGTICGDVDNREIKDIAAYTTPVPGGVGPMTIIFLLINTFIAACWQNKISIDYTDILL